MKKLSFLKILLRTNILWIIQIELPGVLCHLRIGAEGNKQLNISHTI